MKVIEYRIVFAEDQPVLVTVRAQNINSGFTKALKQAKKPLGSGRVRELARIEFWQVKS